MLSRCHSSSHSLHSFGRMAYFLLLGYECENNNKCIKIIVCIRKEKILLSSGIIVVAFIRNGSEKEGGVGEWGGGGGDAQQRNNTQLLYLFDMNKYKRGLIDNQDKTRKYNTISSLTRLKICCIEM